MSSWKGNTTSERQPLLAHPKVQNANTQHQPPTLNQLSKAKLCCVLTAIGTAIFLSALDGTIVATLQQPISNDFGQSHKASYIGTSYLLSICCFTPLYGRLSDILGRKGALLLALSFFTLGTLGCGLAPSMGTFIASRFLAGMGGGGIMTGRIQRWYINITNSSSLEHCPERPHSSSRPWPHAWHYGYC
ncbi:MFS general substrate transporter [Serendipita vermifera]|nr:MFS general substrate transporter [Serendipita vermifera]